MSHNIYVSFTCLPSRIDNLSLIINYIFQQSLKFTNLIINYPKRVLRLNTESDIDKVNSVINNSKYREKIYLNVSHDYGPITKIYPLIHLDFIDLDDAIIIIDDDNHYNPNLFQNLYNEFINSENTVMCISGLIYPTSLNSKCYCIRPNNLCQLIEASFGYIIKRRFLEDDLNDWVIKANNIDEIKAKHYLNSFLSDDYIISRYFDTKKIEKKVINYSEDLNKNNTVIPEESVERNDSLCDLNNTLDRYFRSEFELRLKKLV
jgi:hypothetical protein